MKFFEAITEVRRRLGIVFLKQSDVEWLAKNCIRKNKKVFDELGRN